MAINPYQFDPFLQQAFGNLSNALLGSASNDADIALGTQRKAAAENQLASALQNKALAKRYDAEARGLGIENDQAEALFKSLQGASQNPATYNMMANALGNQTIPQGFSLDEDMFAVQNIRPGFSDVPMGSPQPMQDLSPLINSILMNPKSNANQMSSAMTNMVNQGSQTNKNKIADSILSKAANGKDLTAQDISILDAISGRASNKYSTPGSGDQAIANELESKLDENEKVLEASKYKARSVQVSANYASDQKLKGVTYTADKTLEGTQYQVDETVKADLISAAAKISADNVTKIKIARNKLESEEMMGVKTLDFEKEMAKLDRELEDERERLRIANDHFNKLLDRQNLRSIEIYKSDNKLKYIAVDQNQRILLDPAIGEARNIQPNENNEYYLDGRPDLGDSMIKVGDDEVAYLPGWFAEELGLEQNEDGVYAVPGRNVSGSGGSGGSGTSSSAIKYTATDKKAVNAMIDTVFSNFDNIPDAVVQRFKENLSAQIGTLAQENKNFETSTIEVTDKILSQGTRTFDGGFTGAKYDVPVTIINKLANRIQNAQNDVDDRALILSLTKFGYKKWQAKEVISDLKDELIL